MNVYSAVIRLGNSKENEVFKEHLSAPDVIMLRHIHGDEAVRDVTHVGKSDEPEGALRERMGAFYGTGVFDSSKSGGSLMREVFGPASISLPKTVEGVAHEKAVSRVVIAPPADRLTD